MFDSSYTGGEKNPYLVDVSPLLYHYRIRYLDNSFHFFDIDKKSISPLLVLFIGVPPSGVLEL